MNAGGYGKNPDFIEPFNPVVIFCFIAPKKKNGCGNGKKRFNRYRKASGGSQMRHLPVSGW